MEYVIPLCKIDITKWASKLPQRMVEDFKSECYIEIIKNLENYTPVLEEGSRILGNVYFDYRFRKVFTDFVRQLKKEEKEVHSIENEENIPTNTDLFHDCLMKEVLEVYENHMNNYVAWYAKKKTRQHCKKHNISLNDFLNS